MDLPTFQLAYPIFRTTDAAYVELKLAMATRMVSSKVWGVNTDDGIGLLCAHWLTVDPFGSTTAIKPNATSTYGEQFKAMKIAIIGGGFGVARIFGGGGRDDVGIP